MEGTHAWKLIESNQEGIPLQGSKINKREATSNIHQPTIERKSEARAPEDKNKTKGAHRKKRRAAKSFRKSRGSSRRDCIAFVLT